MRIVPEGAAYGYVLKTVPEERLRLALRSLFIEQKLGVYQPTDSHSVSDTFNLRARAVSIALMRKLLNRNALEQAETELQQWLIDPRHGDCDTRQQDQ